MTKFVIHESPSAGAAECKQAPSSSVTEQIVIESSSNTIAAETEDVFASTMIEDDKNRDLKEELERLIRESKRKRDSWDVMQLGSTTTEGNDGST